MAPNRSVIGELDIAYSSPDEFGQVVLDWLLTGIQVLASDISEEVLADQPVAGETQWDADHDHPVTTRPPTGGEVWIEYGNDGEKSYIKPYSKTSLDRLKKLSRELSGAEISLYRKAGSTASSCALKAEREGGATGFARLLVNIPADTCDESSPEISFMRSFARANAPAFGHVSVVDETLPGWTELELALDLNVRDSLDGLERYLRGYSWVTVVPEVLAAQLGGADALRESGVFSSVDVLAGGSVWLQATPRWSEYGQDQVDRVFEVLAPILPPGMPDSRRVLAPGTTRPYRLSIRDAAEFRAAGK